jgi:hypothetical protein
LNTDIDLYHSWPLFAPFMGISTAWEPAIENRIHAFFQVGTGLVGAQSKNDIDARRPGVVIGPIEDFGLEASGREIVRSVPAYVTFDMGATLHMGRVRVGLSVGTLFLLVNGPVLPKVSVRGPEDPLSASMLDRQYAYRPSFLFIPQIVFGIDP